MPFARVARTLSLAVVAGGAAVATIRGTTPAVLGVGVALFAMSLELLEPLSQEIDHPDRTDGLPVDRDTVLAGHLLVPAMAIVPFALVGAAVVALFEPDAAVAAFALAVPMAWVGACGAVVSTVRDAPDPVARNAPWTPPEFAGFGTAMRVLIPLAVSSIAAIPVVALRESPDRRHRRPLCRRPVAVRGGVLVVGQSAPTMDHGDARLHESGNVVSALVATSQLTKDYGDGPALAPLDLDGRAQASGSASSVTTAAARRTLLRMLVGLLEPTDGTAEIGGHPAGSLEARAVVSYLGDEPVFYDDLSVWEHIEFIGRLHDTDDWEQHGADLLGDGRAHSIAPTTCRSTFSRGLRAEGGDRARLRPAVRAPGGRRALRRSRQGWAGQRSSSCSAVPTTTEQRCSSRPTISPRSPSRNRLVALRDGEWSTTAPRRGADVDDLVGRCHEGEPMGEPTRQTS